MTTCSGFLAPGSETTIWSVPCFWISGSATPNALTRLRMISIERSIASGVTLLRGRGLALEDHLDAALEVEPEHGRLRRDGHQGRGDEADDQHQDEEGALAEVHGREPSGG